MPGLQHKWLELKQKATVFPYWGIREWNAEWLENEEEEKLKADGHMDGRVLKSTCILLDEQKIVYIENEEQIGSAKSNDSVIILDVNGPNPPIKRHTLTTTHLLELVKWMIVFISNADKDAKKLDHMYFDGIM